MTKSGGRDAAALHRSLDDDRLALAERIVTAERLDRLSAEARAKRAIVAARRELFRVVLRAEHPVNRIRARLIRQHGQQLAPRRPMRRHRDTAARLRHRTAEFT